MKAHYYLLATISMFCLRPAPAATVTFGFDSAGLATGHGTPLSETISGVTASFSSPSDGATPAYSIQNAGTTFYTLSLFSGNYLDPSSVFRSALDIKAASRKAASR